ncbi:MAG: membrane protein [Hyphococcus sp.]|nr:MAG: membrane protein [Marinicaulis sp.]
MSDPNNKTPMSDVQFGLLAGVFAYSLWGLFPIYLKALDDVSVFEILAHRIIWSVPFGALLIALRKQWPEVRAAISSRRVLLLLMVSALAISANWLIYVWAVVNDQVLQASLGYYINPLMYVAAGVFILGEKLRPAQIVAVTLAFIGVLVMTFGAGVFPWAAILLAILFTLYGYLRKTTPVGAMPGLFIETSLLAPIALIFLFWLMGNGAAVFTNQSMGKDILLILAGPVTVVPLVLFALSARRLRLSTLGFLQYIGPTLQFILGIYYGETFTLAHAICFGLIWTGLAIYSFDAARANRAEHIKKAV